MFVATNPACVLDKGATHGEKHHGYSGMHGAKKEIKEAKEARWRLWGGSQGIKALHECTEPGGRADDPFLPPHVVIAEQRKENERIKNIKRKEKKRNEKKKSKGKRKEKKRK